MYCTTCCKKGNAACSSWILYISHNWSFTGGTQRPTFEFSVAWCPPNPSNVDLGAFCKTPCVPQLEMFQSFFFWQKLWRDVLAWVTTKWKVIYIYHIYIYKLQNLDCGYDYHVSSWSSIRPQHSLVSLIVLTSPCLRWGHSIRLADVPVFLFLLIKEP